MKLDLQTLAFTLSLTIVSLVIALSIQYRVNRTYRGIGWWLLGSALMALGFIFLPLGTLAHPSPLSMIGNPLLVLGRIGLLVGVLCFVGRKVDPRPLAVFYLLFLGAYYYFMFGHFSLAGRTVAVSMSIAILSVVTAHRLFFNCGKSYAGAAGFTGAIFLIHGCYLVVVTCYTLLSQPIHTYLDYGTIQTAVFIVPTLTSILWTFGFILMVNQRLSAEHLEEKENLRKVFNTSPDAALITRLSDGLVVDANFGFSAMTGYPRSEIVGTSTAEKCLWQDPSDRNRLLALLAREGRCENVEFLFRRKDGSQLVGMTSAKVLSFDDQPHLISVTKDITGKRQAEEALRESEETYRSILKASPDDITITDLEGRILMVSPAACDMFGYEQGEEAGRMLLDFLIPEDRERARSNLGLLLHGGFQGPNDYRGIRKDQTILHIEVNSGIIRGLRGQPLKMVFIVRDITERKRAEAAREELASKTRQLEKAASLGRMAGAVAHHFNNQLQSVLGNLELLSESQGGERESRWLTRAKEAAERAAEVSRHMLVYLGQASRDQRPRLLSELCRGSLPIIQGTLPEFVAIESEFPAPGPVVRANPAQLQQVLVNLVTNAWEALGSDRGSIHLKLTTCPAARIPGTHRFPIDWVPQAQEYACLEVADTGSGIAGADLEKLFDPFFSTKFSGRGLGLSVVLGIVQAHGGALTVESRPGRGSLFKVYLPACPEPEPLPAAHVVEAPGTRGTGGTILLVDDDPFVLQSTGALLESLGYTLLTAKDGEEAVALFRRRGTEISCVLTDLTMPHLDGWQTLAALRGIEPALPVILASGYDPVGDLPGPHAHRPDAFLGKPYDLQTLQEALDQALASPSRYP